MKILVTGAAGFTPSFIHVFDGEGVEAHLRLPLEVAEEGNK
ncbi:MAG TPA: hypothetical protein VMV05_07215 [bacterium]|nr:hypothetical protein [bacterium]